MDDSTTERAKCGIKSKSNLQTSSEILQQHGVVNECHRKLRKYIASVLRFSFSISVNWFFRASRQTSAERVKAKEFLFSVETHTEFL